MIKGKLGRVLLCAVAGGSAFFTAASADAAVIEVRLSDDQRLFDYEATAGDTTTPSQGVSNDLRVGTSVIGTPGRLASAILPFPLPALAPGETIQSATLTIQIVPQAAANAATTSNGDLYGLPFDEEPDVDITSTRHFSGADDTTAGVVKLQDNFLTPANAAPTTGSNVPITSIDVSSYLNALYTGGADEGDFAVLRISDDTPNTAELRRYRFRSAGGTNAANPAAEKPVLTITTIPEPAMTGLAALATLSLLARRRPPQL